MKRSGRVRKVRTRLRPRETRLAASANVLLQGNSRVGHRVDTPRVGS